MTVSDIKEQDVKLASMIINYKVYQSSRLNSMPGGVVQAAYEIVTLGKCYDLVDMVRSELPREFNLTNEVQIIVGMYIFLCT